MFRYTYINVKANGVLFKNWDHREIIDKYSNEGYRFVTAIPTGFEGYGKITRFDLVFEKEE
ncbi:MAG: DUF4177 domain-containing protein [Clostridiaceae bacterium]